MDSLARFTITHARFTGLLIFSLRQEDPEITLRSAQVVTEAPGLSPERIEQLITRPIEDAVKRIPEIDDIESLDRALHRHRGGRPALR
jgi:multidrug efflux pump subunit AcrB